MFHVGDIMDLVGSRRVDPIIGSRRVDPIIYTSLLHMAYTRHLIPDGPSRPKDSLASLFTLLPAQKHLDLSRGGMEAGRQPGGASEAVGGGPSPWGRDPDALMKDLHAQVRTSICVGDSTGVNLIVRISCDN